MFKSVLLGGVLAAVLAAAGCGSRHYGYRSYGPPPPPPPRAMGPMGYAPGPGYVWIDGYYDLRGPRWVWTPGYWVRPPRARAVWVKPRWERHGNRYRFHRGRWR